MEYQKVDIHHLSRVLCFVVFCIKFQVSYFTSFNMTLT